MRARLWPAPLSSVCGRCHCQRTSAALAGYECSVERYDALDAQCVVRSAIAILITLLFICNFDQLVAVRPEANPGFDGVLFSRNAVAGISIASRGEPTEKCPDEVLRTQ
jgi:hypothetical protein